MSISILKTKDINLQNIHLYSHGYTTLSKVGQTRQPAELYIFSVLWNDMNKYIFSKISEWSQ